MDFDFARYIAMRKGEVEQRARDGATYSYMGERKLRRALVGARPVTLALEATQKLWRGNAKDELTAGATLVTDEAHPRVAAAGQRAAQTLGLSLPPIFISQAASVVGARALGTDDDPTLFLAPYLAEGASDDELCAILARELGHVQNNHILYTTSLYYLAHSAAFFVRWIVQPAVMALKAWSRRADVTCDRAALICTRDFDIAARAIIKMTLGESEQDRVDEVLAAVTQNVDRPSGRLLSGIGDLFRAHPSLERRLAALKLFETSRFYLRFTGGDPDGAPGSEDIDDQVARIMGGQKAPPEAAENDDDEDDR